MYALMVPKKQFEKTKIVRSAPFFSYYWPHTCKWVGKISVATPFACERKFYLEYQLYHFHFDFEKNFDIQFFLMKKNAFLNTYCQKHTRQDIRMVF